MNGFRIAGLLAGALALSGCSSDDDPLLAYCSGFGNGATFTWTAPCTGCTVTQPLFASDGSLYTTARIVPDPDPVTTDTAVLTATSVADIAGGAVVGVWVTQPAGLTSTSNSFRTLLNGAQVEVSNANNGVVIAAEDGTVAAGFLGMRTTQVFDTVEFTTTNTWNVPQTPIYNVYEICSDGGNS